MAKRVEEFVHNMLIKVLNTQDTANLVIASILETGSHDPGPKATQIEDPGEWTPGRITQRAAAIQSDKGPKGNYDD